MVARKLGHTRQVIVASPDYLQRFGRPQHPDELAGHVRIGWNYPRAIPHWPFVVAGKAVTVSMGEVLRVNDGEAMANLAKAGAGLARLSLYHAWDDLHAGRLQALLEDFNPGDLQPIHAVYGQARPVAGEDAGGAGFSGQPCGPQSCRANARRLAAGGA
jgi:DNA-binding transcriptional LysR family regulator